MSALRTVTRLAAALALAGVAALGVLWGADRARRWEHPRWTPSGFVAMRGQTPGRAARWVMVVNPDCPGCMTALARLDAAWASGTRLAVLIVDTPEPPGTRTLREIPTREVWWDRHGVWRRRWGHRLYGELIEFDATGRSLRTVPAADVLHALEGESRGRSTTPAGAPTGGR